MIFYREFFNPARIAVLQARREAAITGREALRRAEAEAGERGPVAQRDALVEVSGVTTVRFTVEYSLLESSEHKVG